jgi:hypothetical protein
MMNIVILCNGILAGNILPDRGIPFFWYKARAGFLISIFFSAVHFGIVPKFPCDYYTQKVDR